MQPRQAPHALPWDRQQQRAISGSILCSILVRVWLERLATTTGVLRGPEPQFSHACSLPPWPLYAVWCVFIALFHCLPFNAHACCPVAVCRSGFR